MRSAIDLTPDQRRNVQAILERYLPGTVVWAFGSRVSFKARPDSDLDLVAFTTPDQKPQVSALKEAFEESDLPFRVDLLVWDEIPENFRKNIEGGEVSTLAGAEPRSPILPEGWRKIRLGDHIVSMLGKMLDQNKNIGVFESYLGNSDVRWGYFELSNLSKMRFEQSENERYGIKYGDLIVCEGGEPGRCAIWKNQLPNMKIQKALHRIRTKNDLSINFLYYWFLLSGKKNSLEPYFTGTTIKHLTGKAIQEIELVIPPLPQQQKIAAILSALDDKIALNRATNQTLEQIAQAIFKSWFVDFDPVHAKARGEQPIGMDAATADLFPDSFQESELGMIPKGWEVKKIGDIIDRKKTNKRYQKKEALPFGKTPVYEQGNSILLGYHDSVAEYQASIDSPMFIFGDHTCITKLSTIPFDVSQNTIVVEGNILPTNWVFYAILGKQKFQEYRRHWMEFIEKDIVVPGLELCIAFAEKIKSLQYIIDKNSTDISIITELRDSLLPKLLSGEISVAEAAEQAAGQ